MDSDSSTSVEMALLVCDTFSFFLLPDFFWFHQLHCLPFLTTEQNVDVWCQIGSRLLKSFFFLNNSVLCLNVSLSKKYFHTPEWFST